MKFTLEIKMDGAAFHEGQEPHDEGRAHGYEVANLLRKVADRIAEGDLSGPYPPWPQQAAIQGDTGVIIDSWGASVGTWSVTS